jgi:hypothetical protein
MNSDHQSIILCLDDNLGLLDSLCEILEDVAEGRRIEKFGTFDSAAKFLENNQERIVMAIVDERLSDRDDEKDGIKFLQLVKESCPNAKKIAFTGEASAEEIAYMMMHLDLDLFQWKGNLAPDLNRFRQRIALLLEDCPMNPAIAWWSESRRGEDEPVSGEAFLLQLRAIQPGRQAAEQYQRIVFDFLDYLFKPDLSSPRLELTNDSQISRYDILFANRARRGFWHDLKLSWGNNIVIFDAKNKKSLVPSDADQLLRYSGEFKGRVLFLVCRSDPPKAYETRPVQLLKDHGVCILVLSDADLEKMYHLRVQGMDPAEIIEEKLTRRIAGT